MRAGDSPASVLMFAFGTFSTASVNSIGAFAFQNQARENTRVQFISVLDKYRPLDTLLSVKSGKDSLLADTIEMPLAIPLPKNVALQYDSLLQVVHLTWSNADPAVVKSFNVYRQQTIRQPEIKLTTVPVTDTFFVDSNTVQDQTFTYSLAPVNMGNAEGERTNGISVQIRGAFVFKRVIGSAGTGVGQYQYPIAVASYINGTVLTAQPDGKILKFDTLGNYIRSYGGITSPVGIVAKSNGNFYVLDNSTMLITYMDSAGNVLAQFGGPGSGYGKFGRGCLRHGKWQWHLMETFIFRTIPTIE